MDSSSCGTIGRGMMSQSKFYMGYSRWDEGKGRYETWGESVERVMNMHRSYYADKMTPELEELIDFVELEYKNKSILGAQRALQFGGEQLLRHQARLYNCVSTYIDRPLAFQETMYLLLCGCGVGFSVQKQHIDKLPSIGKRYTKKSKVFTVPDSIEGWADAYGVLLSSYFEEDQPFPEYKACQVHFDFSKIRPKGAFISGGFKAPGPDGLRVSLQRCEDILNKASEGGRLRPIEAYDLIMHMADAVLSGGVRRSATICMFSKDDTEMLKAKTGNWFVTNPQRGRSNNSVMLLRDEITRLEWAAIMESVKDYGEPGFIFTDNLDFTYNPCVEIGKMPKTSKGVSGFQGCNLTEINGAMCTSKERLLSAAKAASILGTLQAGYTNFKYLTEASKEIFERESLIGVSITGWMNSPDILFDEKMSSEGALTVVHWNKVVAGLIGINAAARTTCVKPSGNASVLLGTASGIHGEHSKYYFRNVQMNEQDDVLHTILKHNPIMVEDSVWSSTGTDKVVSFPVISPEGSIYKKDLLGIKQLEYVKKAQQVWVELGTNLDLCVDKRLRHNVSNTITVDDWDEVEQYIFDNRQWFAGISLLSSQGDKAYPQAPFTEVTPMQDIVAKWGEASLFASGLIVDALHAFEDNLWTACDTLQGRGITLSKDDSHDLLKRDWVRRAQKFSDNFFKGDIQEMTNCLKDCHNLHKWISIRRSIKPIDFAEELNEKVFVDVDSMGAQSCSGGACEISF